MLKEKKRKWLVVGNWKMNPTSVKEAKRLFASVKKSASKKRNVETVACPPFVYLSLFKSSGHRFVLGSQDLFFEPEGAHTGEISYLQLKNLGIKYSIVGHSEKRAKGETDKDVNLKVKSALRGMITPIVCIGENFRDDGGEYLQTLKEQIEVAFVGLPKTAMKDVVIAYEPVWAIGKDAKAPATPREVFETTIFIKRVLSDLYNTKSVPPTKILYGGSVDEHNLESFAKSGGVDGFLVGRASLNSETFNSLLNNLDSLK